MPFVPRADQGLVPTAPTPGVRVPTEIPRASFGTAEPPLDLSGVQTHVRTIVDDETQKADQVAVSAADAAIVRAKTARLWDPQTGAMNARGKDAIAVSDAAQQGFQKDADQILDELTTDRQRAAVQRRIAMHYADLGGQLGQHVATQIKQYDADTTNGHIDALAEAAAKSYTDPLAVQRSIDDTRAVMTDYWRRNGHARGTGVDDYAQQHIADRVSAIRASVFSQLSSTGQDLAASAYFEAHQDDFTGKDREVAEKIAKAGSSRAKAQAETARILSASPASLTDALADADTIAEPTVQDDVKRRIRQHYADQASDLLRTRQQAYQQASKLLEESGGDMDTVPLSLRTILLPGENEALQHRADQIRHPKDFGDSASFYHLKNLAHISDESRQQFAKENIATGYPNLSEQQRSSLLTLQRQVQTQLHTQAVRDSTKAAKAGATGAANVAATPVPTQHPYNPLAGIVHVAPTPTKPPTKAMLDDVARKGEGYATYLRGMGYNIPSTATKAPAP